MQITIDFQESTKLNNSIDNQLSADSAQIQYIVKCAAMLQKITIVYDWSLACSLICKAATDLNRAHGG